MKIQILIQADAGIPFYLVEVGQYFQYINSNSTIRHRSDHIFEHSQVFKKVDQVGAIDYPYNKSSEENTMFIGEKALVKVIKKTDKRYKNYVKEVEQLLSDVNKLYDDLVIEDR
jgi:hypothetical protein